MGRWGRDKWRISKRLTVLIFLLTKRNHGSARQLASAAAVTNSAHACQVAFQSTKAHRCKPFLSQGAWSRNVKYVKKALQTASRQLSYSQGVRGHLAARG